MRTAKHGMLRTPRDVASCWLRQRRTGRAGAEPLTKQDFEELALFRFGTRRYVHLSAETVRRHGRGWATVRESADRLQLRHHSVIELMKQTCRWSNPHLACGRGRCRPGRHRG
jgi:hypothetical protein